MSISRGKRAICIRTGSGGCDVLIRPRARDYFFTGDGCAICKVATDTLRIGHDLLRTLHSDFIVGQFSGQRCCIATCTFSWRSFTFMRTYRKIPATIDSL